MLKKINPEKQKQYEKMALDAIKKQKYILINDIAYSLPFSRTTFYDYQLDKSDCIKEALSINKIEIKQQLKKEWLKTGSSSERIILYKLCATREELDIINSKEETESQVVPNITVMVKDTSKKD